MFDIDDLLKALASLIPKIDLSMLKVGNLDFNAVKDLSILKEAKLSLLNANNFQMIINLAVSKNNQELKVDNMFVGSPRHACYQLEQKTSSAPALNLLASPFSAGIHLILDNPQWLRSEEPYKLSAHTVLFPISSGNTTRNVDLEGERTFTVSFEDGIPRMISWRWDREARTDAQIVFSKDYEYKNSLNNDSWIMSPMELDTAHLIETNDSLAMTFSSAIVARAWKLIRTHVRENPKRHKQAFIYVVAKPSLK